MNIDIFSFFPSGISAERTLSFQYNSDNRLLFSFLQVLIFCGRQLDDYFPNQVASAKIIVAMAPKVVAAWRVELGLLKVALLSTVTEGVTVLLDIKMVLLFRDEFVIVDILDPVSEKEEVVSKKVLLGVA